MWTIVIFGILAISDAIDGIVARSLQQVSKIGAIFDPIADKLLVATGLVGLLAQGMVPPWPVALILSREFLVLGLRILDASQAGKIIAAERLGKMKTISQLAAIGWLILGWPFGNVLLWTSVVLTWASGLDYWVRYTRY